VEVDVKYLLHCSRSVGQEEIDAFAPQATTANRGRYSLRFLHQPPRRRRVEVGEISCMTHGDHQDVPGIHRLDIHESGALLISKQERGRQVAFQQSTEDAVSHRIKMVAVVKRTRIERIKQVRQIG
jgi:23S rRNA-/tRNA-specific pseudouridylate synthase